ncbi:hypothetical protein RintRC_2431 [Richelia intracellularis]|nr:hypothetical protein RintRC_2431 [Richelia intracellularis]
MTSAWGYNLLQDIADFLDFSNSNLLKIKHSASMPSPCDNIGKVFYVITRP